MKNMRKQNGAFTLIELIVLIAVVAVLAGSLLPGIAGTRTTAQAQRLTCGNNLKQVGVAFRSWAISHGGNMPMAVANSSGGASDDVGFRVLATSQSGSHGVSKMFLCLSNQLSTPKVLFCPAEYEASYRKAATTFAGSYGGTGNPVLYINDLNVSYFIGVDAAEAYPRMLLSGDHNLGGNANPPAYPYLAAPSTGMPFVYLGTAFATNAGPAWMDTMHAQHGNVVMADGSVEWFSRSKLQDALRNSGDRGRAAAQFVQAAGVTAGAGCNRIQLP